MGKRHPGSLDLVIDEWCELKTPDWSSVVTKILAKKPEIIVTTLIGGEGAHFVKACREQAYSGDFIFTSSLDPEVLRTVAGPEFAYGVYHFGMDWKNPPTEELKEYFKQFTDRYKELPMGCQIWSVDHVGLLSRAIEEAQSIDPKVVAKTMESWRDFPTMFGTANWGGLKTWGINHQIFKPQTISATRKGGVSETVGVLEVDVAP